MVSADARGGCTRRGGAEQARKLVHYCGIPAIRILPCLDILGPREKMNHFGRRVPQLRVKRLADGLPSEDRRGVKGRYSLST
jgi:hypothetical protein